MSTKVTAEHTLNNQTRALADGHRLGRQAETAEAAGVQTFPFEYQKKVRRTLGAGGGQAQTCRRVFSAI